MRFTRILLKHVARSTEKYSNLPKSYIKRAMEQVIFLLVFVILTMNFTIAIQVIEEI